MRSPTKAIIYFAFQLPLNVYESVIDVADGAAVTRLVSLGYTLATEEAERIGVDHVAKMSNVGSGTESSGIFWFDSLIKIFVC